jgi:hypothetical protein
MKTLISADIPSDLVSYVEERPFDVVLLELSQKMEAPMSPQATFMQRFV